MQECVLDKGLPKLNLSPYLVIEFAALGTEAKASDRLEKFLHIP